MRKLVIVLAGCAAMLLGMVQVQAQSHANKGNSGQLVIVFKDGHRQTFNFADVARIEFAGNRRRSFCGCGSDAGRCRSSRTFPRQVESGRRCREHLLHHPG